MTDAAEIRYMRLALSLGQRGSGTTWPNPAVGCVIVRDGRIVGRGWTQPGGRPHAEVVALTQAGEAARGATAYVTLEPCAHHGKTPPCAEALVAAGIARVVVATGDPDERVAGRGIQILQDAGISVVSGVCRQQADQAHAGFFSRVTRGRPTVTLKLANSFDGRIATATGDSQWITGPKARRAVHADRARHDAVLVGGGTARADDPGLTVRGLGIDHQPVRIVASRRVDIPLTGQLARTAQDVPVWVCHGADADPDLVATWKGLSAQMIPVQVTGRQLSVSDLLSQLGQHGLTSVYCEGGGALAASLLASDCVDRMIGYTAGVVLGAEGQPSLGAMGIDVLGEAPRFALEDVRQIGPDVEHVWQRIKE